MNKQIILLVGLAIALGVAGCTPVDEQGDAERAKSEKRTPGRISIPSLQDGDSIDLESYKGKVVLLDFWATWCPPCRFELPTLNKIHADLRGDGFSVIGMTVDKGSVEKVKPKVAAFDIQYPVGLADSEIQAKYGEIRAVPTKFLLDREGAVSKSYVGVVPEEELRTDIKALLAQK